MAWIIYSNDSKLLVIFFKFIGIFLMQSSFIISNQHSAYSNLNCNARCSAQRSCDSHRMYICDMRWSCDALVITFQIPICDDHVTYFHNVRWSHDTLLTTFWPQPSKVPGWLHFSLSSSDWNRPKNGHTGWLTVWINTNIGQPCCHDYTRLCMTVQGCVKAE